MSAQPPPYWSPGPNTPFPYTTMHVLSGTPHAQGCDVLLAPTVWDNLFQFALIWMISLYFIYDRNGCNGYFLKLSCDMGPS